MIAFVYIKMVLIEGCVLIDSLVEELEIHPKYDLNTPMDCLLLLCVGVNNDEK